MTQIIKLEKLIQAEIKELQELQKTHRNIYYIENLETKIKINTLQKVMKYIKNTMV